LRAAEGRTLSGGKLRQDSDSKTRGTSKPEKQAEQKEFRNSH
jgi:hypothetical protein